MPGSHNRAVTIFAAIIMLVPMLVLMTANAAATSVASSPVLIDFEQYHGPTTFNDATPTTLTIGAATISGGAILTNETGEDSDHSTVYATANTNCTGCTSKISIQFSQAVTDFSIDVANGIPQIVYTVTTNTGATESQTLQNDGPGGALHFSINVYGITSVTISQPSDLTWDFAIDNIRFSLVDTSLDHYVITTKAWIPIDMLVDPVSFYLGRFPSVLADPSYDFPLCNVTDISSIDSVFSTFRGDGHDDYGDPFRVMQVISFDWDGHSVTNLAHHAIQGATHRDITVYLKDGSNVTCTQQETSTPSDTATLPGFWGTGFDSTLTARNPLGPKGLPAPPIKVNLHGRFGSNGALTINYSTTAYPNIGVNVVRNGHDLGTTIINDASCVGEDAMFGQAGISNIFMSLGLASNFGSYAVSDSGSVAPKDSWLCTFHFSPGEPT